MKLKASTAIAGALSTLLLATPLSAEALSQWSDGANKTAITEFVTSVTTEGSEHYLTAANRVAVFDNDGTLWTEKPAYTEVVFALSQVKAMAADHPEWQTQEPFSIILEKGLGSLREIGLRGAIVALTAVYAELDEEEFNTRAKAFLNSKHLKGERSNIDTTYAPMVELVNYLRANDFEIYIVSGGTNGFLRVLSETAYGVSPRNVIGSALATEVVAEGDNVTVKKLPKLAYMNNDETKVLNILRTIGSRPTIVVGNSDGDLPMISHALKGDGPHLGLLIQHDDETRESAYDRGAKEAIAAAAPEGDNFLLVSMMKDFASIWKP